MRIYSVGVDELDDHELSYVNPDLFEWLVYSYEYTSSYEAVGLAVALRNDGKLVCAGLGHCSCHGPIDDAGWGQSDGYVTTVEEILRKKDSIHDDDADAAVKAKVVELLGI